MFHLDPNTSTLHHATPPTTSAATVHVDMGKVVGVLRTTHAVAVNQTDHEDEDDSTYEENTIGNMPLGYFSGRVRVGTWYTLQK